MIGEDLGLRQKEESPLEKGRLPRKSSGLGWGPDHMSVCQTQVAYMYTQMHYSVSLALVSSFWNRENTVCFVVFLVFGPLLVLNLRITHS